MHRWIVLCAVIVSQVSVHGQGSKVTTKWHVIQLSTVNALVPRCGARKPRVYACTQFVAPHLSAECSVKNDAWILHARPGFVALIYIVDRTFIGHELLHIGDMEEALHLYLARLENERFSSAESCAMTAKSEDEKFSQTMKAFADQSNAQRH